jgi:hypothetical protein
MFQPAVVMHDRYTPHEQILQTALEIAFPVDIANLHESLMAIAAGMGCREIKCFHFPRIYPSSAILQHFYKRKIKYRHQIRRRATSKNVSSHPISLSFFIFAWLEDASDF